MHLHDPYLSPAFRRAMGLLWLPRYNLHRITVVAHSDRSAYHADFERLFSFFFFQAEDGIRDLTVTGVQTCALPIYGEPLQDGHVLLVINEGGTGDRISYARWLPELTKRGINWRFYPYDVLFPFRSEERRVGKEGRSRWAPDH